MSTLSIKSSVDDTVLSIKDIHRDKSGELQDYRVCATRTGLESNAKVCGYLSDGFIDFLIDLDETMSRNNGWSGEKSWTSLEGEFDLSATSDSLGHVTLIATIKSGHYDLDWVLHVGLELDAIKLSELSKDAKRLVSDDA